MHAATFVVQYQQLHHTQSRYCHKVHIDFSINLVESFILQGLAQCEVVVLFEFFDAVDVSSLFFVDGRDDRGTDWWKHTGGP